MGCFAVHRRRVRGTMSFRNIYLVELNPVSPISWGHHHRRSEGYKRFKNRDRRTLHPWQLSHARYRFGERRDLE